MYAYINTCRHVYDDIHIKIHAYIHAYKHTYTYIHIYIHTNISMFIQTSGSLRLNMSRYDPCQLRERKEDWVGHEGLLPCVHACMHVCFGGTEFCYLFERGVFFYVIRQSVSMEPGHPQGKGRFSLRTIWMAWSAPFYACCSLCENMMV